MAEGKEHDDPWQVGWEAHHDHQLTLGLAATPAERLAWLEEMIALAHQTGALPRPPVNRAYRLRRATSEDFEFCYRLNETNMRALVDGVRGWNDAAEREAMRRQFRAGDDHIIVVDDRDVGHLGLDDRGDHVFVRMIALLPDVQGCGIGAALLREIVRSAETRGRSVRVTVTGDNVRAIDWYRRVGFRVIGELHDAEKRVTKIEMLAPPSAVTTD